MRMSCRFDHFSKLSFTIQHCNVDKVYYQLLSPYNVIKAHLPQWD